VEARNRLGNISKKVTAICAACSWLARFASSVNAKIHGAKHRPWLTHCWSGDRPRLLLSPLANNSREWFWAMMVKGERYKTRRA